MKTITNDQKAFSAKCKQSDRVSGKDLLTIEVKRLKSHKELLSDWMYTEMEEHAKKLEIYADLFKVC